MNERAESIDLSEDDPVTQARVVHYMRHALSLLEEGQESLTTALEYFEKAAGELVARVDDALAGRLPLTELTAEQRGLFNRIVDESITARLAGSDYATDLLVEGITVVYLDGDQLVEKKPAGTTKRLR